MSTHTKGPWVVDGSGIRAIVRGVDVTIVAVRHRLAAEVHEANARMIAAAPELLDALQALYAGPCSAYDEPERTRISMNVSREAFKKMEAAIAKATGGAK